MIVKLIVTGGFLGAGKTTLLLKASQLLIERGKKVGLITNDQAPELVDSVLLSNNKLEVAEVSGSCFCCNFNGLINAVQKYNAAKNIDYIIAEPVGSCTDLSATIMQPLKQFHEKTEIAPLSILADPVRLSSILEGENAGLHKDAAYIYKKQLEESDIIVITKSDSISAACLENLIEKTKQTYPLSTVMTLSAVTGDGIDKWLDEVIRRNDAGNKLIDIDYDVYAHGEAVLGWLNGTVALNGEKTDWDIFITSFMKDLCACFEKENLPTGHVKAILENEEKVVIVNFTGGIPTVTARGTAGSSEKCKLTINARVETSPENLNSLVRAILRNCLKIK